LIDEVKFEDLLQLYVLLLFGVADVFLIDYTVGVRTACQVESLGVVQAQLRYGGWQGVVLLFLQCCLFLGEHTVEVMPFPNDEHVLHT